MYILVLFIIIVVNGFVIDFGYYVCDYNHIFLYFWGLIWGRFGTASTFKIAVCNMPDCNLQYSRLHGFYNVF